MGGTDFHKWSQSAPWMRTTYLVGELLHDLKKQGLLLFSCPGFRVDKVVVGALHCLVLGVTEEVVWQCHLGDIVMVGLGFQAEECQVCYNVEQVATARQGA